MNKHGKIEENEKILFPSVLIGRSEVLNFYSKLTKNNQFHVHFGIKLGSYPSLIDKNIYDFCLDGIDYAVEDLRSLINSKDFISYEDEKVQQTIVCLCIEYALGVGITYPKN